MQVRILVFPLLVAAIACGSPAAPRTTANGAGADARRAPALFAHVPASTPYFIGAFEAIPRDYYAKLGELMVPAVESAIAEARAKGEHDTLRVFDAMRAELAGKWNRAGLESLGLSSAPRFAMYGLETGAIVVRLEIGNERALIETAERIARRIGVALPAGETRAGRRFWRFDEPTRAYVVAIADGQLVFASVSTDRGVVERSLPAILGIEKPKQSMADGRVVAALAKRHGFGPHLIAYVDTKRVVDIAVAAEPGQLTLACTKELHALAARVPRIAMGMRELGIARTTMAFIVELAPSLTAQLQALRTSLPGFREMLADRPLFAVAAAVDIPEALALASRAIGQLGQVGSACGEHDAVAETTALADMLATAVPQRVLELAGAAARVETLVWDGQSVPRELEAVLLVASSQPKQLFELVQQQLPWLARLSSEPDAKLQPIDLMGLVPFPLHAGVGERAVVAAAGSRSAPLAERVLLAHPEGVAPLFAITYDHGRFLALKGVLASSGAIDPEKAAEYEVEARAAHLFGRASGAIDITQAGLELWMTYEMK